MNLSLSNMLSSSASGLDPDAKGYIDAVVTAGATVSATQKKAINTFVKTGKSDGWYSSIKRIYLPIWASAAPNAICMTSLTSGTFNGTVTHAAGYVQGNGSTGYFNVGAAPSSLGVTLSSSNIIVLVKAPMTAGSRWHMGVAQVLNNTQTFGLEAQGGTKLVSINSDRTNVNGNISYAYAGNSQQGVLIGGRNSGDSYIQRRLSSGFSELARETEGDTGTMPFSRNLILMAFNYTSGPLSFSDAEYGCFALGTGLSLANNESLSLALKALWETCTGLTLP